jgi:t-SNARE complex subunit (syntaxin)
MWPVLVQLLKLAPHVTRLAPVADRYLQSKSDNGKSQRRALDEMGERLRGDLGQLAEGMRGDLTQLAVAQAGIEQQMTQQSEALTSIAADVRAMRLASDEFEARLTRIERGLQRLWMMLLVALIVFVIFGVGMIVVLHSRQ